MRGNLEDPRIERTKQHPLRSLVAIAILAVICGADSWVAIETYACAKRDWLEQFLPLPNGIPSKVYGKYHFEIEHIGKERPFRSPHQPSFQP
jgi:hypothetical protein